MRSLVISSQITVPGDELTFTFVRSSGPGGQNVNKVNSKAVLRWAVASTGCLPDHVRQRFLTTYPSRITQGGDLVLSSQRHRDQPRNVTDCLEKLRSMIMAVVEAPKKRKPTRPSRGAVQRRLKAKRESSRKKQDRRPPGYDD